MSNSRVQYLLKGLLGRCPRCDSTDMFETRYRLYARCPKCHLPLEHEDGWSLGAIPLNYAMTCIFWVLPVGLLLLFGLLSLKSALILAGSGAAIIPFLTYRFSKSLWIGIYYAVLPHELEEDSHKEKGTL